MKLPFSFGLKKKEEKSYYLALLLQDEKVGAVVLEEVNGAIHVVGHAEEHFPSSLEEASFEEWLTVIDKTVSSAEESLPSKIQTEKTVFGVKQDWLIEGKIKRGYLTRLKKICEELALQPIGFLVFTEAILHLLQKEEGAPVSTVLVELGKKFIIISIVRAGRIIETKLIPFEEPVTQAVDTALKEFSVEILPSRIIIFTSESNNALTQAFINHSWSKTLPFLHMPQVSVLPSTFDTKSVLYGTAAQLGFAVVGADSLPTKTRSQSQSPVVNEEKQGEEPKEDTLDLEQEEPNEEKQETPPTDLPQTVSADYFGFLQEADVAKNSPIQKKQTKHFEKEETIKEPNEIEEELEELPEEEKIEETEEFEARNFSTSAMVLFAGVKNGIGKLLAQRSVKGITKQLMQFANPLRTFLMQLNKNGVTAEPNKKLRSPGGFPLQWLLIPAGILIIVFIIVFYIFGVSAKVTLTANPKVLSNQQPVTFVTDGSSSVDQGTLAGQTVSVDEKGSLSEQTTGVKQVGTSAKGTVTIVNVSDTASLSAGTVLTSSDGKKFTLDSDTNVPAGDVITPGTTNANVTAGDIGPEYNMPSGTKFTIGGSSTIGAKNDAAFSGGTKKDVIIVAQADVDKLSSDLIKSLEDKAKADLEQQVGADKTLLPLFTKEDLSQEAFNSKVGDQAQNLSLNATVTYESIVVNKADMTSFASSAFAGTIPSDMTLTSDGIQTSLADIKQTKNSVSGTLTMKASLLPKIDTTQLAKTLAGKSFQQAENSLKAIPQIQNVDFVLAPNLPFIPHILPRLPNHIHISLLSQ